MLCAATFANFLHPAKSFLVNKRLMGIPYNDPIILENWAHFPASGNVVFGAALNRVAKIDLVSENDLENRNVPNATGKPL